MKNNRFRWKIPFRITNENRYLKRVTAIIMAFSLSIVILVSAGLFAGANDIVKKEVYNANLGVLSQLATYVDMYILENIQTVINDNFIDIENDQRLQDFFKNDNCSMKSYYYLIDFMANIENKNSFMDSICIYSLKNDAVISSNEGLTQTARYDSYGNIADIYQIIKKGNKRQFWISPAQNRNDIITYVQLIPAMSYDNYDGFVAINIDSDKVVKEVNNKFAKSGNIAVISEDGTLLSHSDKNVLKQGTLQFDHRMFEQDDGTFSMEINAEKQDVVWVKSQKSNMRYAVLFSKQAYADRLQILQIYSLLIMFGMLVIVFVSSRYISRWLTKPMLKNATFLEGKFVHDIVHGNLSEDEDITTRRSILDAQFEQKKFYVLMLEASHLALNDIYFTEKKNIAKVSKENVKEILSEYGTVMCASETLSQVAVIYNTDISKEEVLALGETLLRKLKENIGISFNIVISDDVDRIQKIRSMSDSVYQLLEYRYIFGYGCIFTFDDLKKWGNDFEMLSAKEQSDLEKRLRMGQIDEFSEEVEKIISAIREGKYSVATAKGLLFQIQSVIYRIGKEKGKLSGNVEISELLADSDPVKTVDEYEIRFGFALETFKKDSVKTSDRQGRLIGRVEEYVVSNIGKNISLNSVADAMNISPTYLSRIFKDETGTNFSTFLADKKLEKATELLCSTKFSMSEIAEQIGYSNETYFTKLFKAKYGTTPGQYRKLNR